MTFLHGLLIFGAAMLAGMINSVAGGGTLVTFPALIWLGQAPITANATSTVALWPGSLGGMWGYRRELRQSEPRFLVLIIPSLIGGITGAVLLRHTPPAAFARLVPFLILFATILFTVNEPVQRLLRRQKAAASHQTGRWLIGASLFQFLVAVYGGYFGAGIGILMLAALGLLGMTDIHQMNGLKNLFALSINGVAAVYFIVAGMVHWPEVSVMVVGAVAGGYGSAGIARRLGPRFVRRTVIVIGLAMTISLLIHRT